jgi:hypothetical protein
LRTRDGVIMSIVGRTGANEMVPLLIMFNESESMASWERTFRELLVAYEGTCISLRMPHKCTLRSGFACRMQPRSVLLVVMVPCWARCLVSIT